MEFPTVLSHIFFAAAADDFMILVTPTSIFLFKQKFLGLTCHFLMPSLAHISDRSLIALQSRRPNL